MSVSYTSFKLYQTTVHSPPPLLDFQFRLKVGKSSWDQRKTIRRSGIVLLQGRQVKRESENVTTTDTLGRISTEMTRKYNCHCPSSVLFSFLLVPSRLPTGQKAQAQKLKAKNEEKKKTKSDRDDDGVDQKEQEHDGKKRSKNPG